MTHPQRPWPPFGLDIVPMYDANFQYLDMPGNTERDWIFDHTKRLHPTDTWMFSIGGEERIRYEDFQDYQLTGTNQSQTLERQRVYADLWYRDLFRIYVEYVDAQSIDPELPPSPIDVRRNDLLNAFADIKLAEIADEPLYFRIGRQELIYGSERLISSFDWGERPAKLPGREDLVSKRELGRRCLLCPAGHPQCQPRLEFD